MKIYFLWVVVLLSSNISEKCIVSSVIAQMEAARSSETSVRVDHCNAPIYSKTIMLTFIRISHNCAGRTKIFLSVLRGDSDEER
jgi:hypothetical protein